MAPGERELERALRSLAPVLHGERYAFAEAQGPALGDEDFAIVREVEGLCVIRPDANGQWARISLGLHSSLELCGLTAELSRRLAGAGLPANIVAGLRHDHLFVPWDRRDEALALLQAD